MGALAVHETVAHDCGDRTGISTGQDLAVPRKKHGFGPLELATDEEKLSENLKASQDRLAKGKWLHRLEIGETWIEPESDHQRARDDCLRIPVQAGHRFHGKPATHSRPKRPLIPREAGHPFHGKPATPGTLTER